MTDQSFKFPRFFVTAPMPCPYLPGRHERKVFTELRGHEALELNEALARIGFRRSQNVAYRPSCDGCQACVSVRVPVARFVPSASQRRLARRNAPLIVSICEPWSTEEQFELLQAYLGHRHPTGGMAAMDAYDFNDMIEASPIDTLVIEYREPRDDGRPGKLVAVCLTDRQTDGLSLVYSFYLPDHPRWRGLGTSIILDHIARARVAGLAHVYLGYWIAGSPRMSYKTRFQPLERLTAQGWRPFEEGGEGVPPPPFIARR